MVYAINNRVLYRGFHPCLDGKKKITKPDGKAVKGHWISGCLVTIPMPTPQRPRCPFCVFLGQKRKWIASATIPSVPVPFLCSLVLGFSRTGTI